MKLIMIICMIFLSVFCSDATAGELNQKLSNFPEWEKLNSVQPAVGDLIYPEWMKGEWEVKSTLVDLVAPLAPDIVTPGFESNRQYLNQPISFKVRFIDQSKLKNLAPSYRTPKLKNLTPSYRTPLSLLRRGEKEDVTSQTPLSFTRRGAGGEVIIADRAYNGLNLARAVLGENTVKAVKVDPNSPNRQITFLRSECNQRINCDRQLVSIVKNRATENTADGKFITAEVFEQLFKGSSVPYINTVESTTAYRQLSKVSSLNLAIEANQVTAVYLSSQDPNYFKAVNKPVALYKYRLEFFPIDKG
ncbi:hypothetical protein Riv7116_2032 [Rivularia sp. PCC 7116]|uniref:DUF6816 family protein n=1 Tax=Rivularia sp. PCC 7116 TaxID=373994 RepID=UPI00029F0244|nr:hypothetical protein [Rivularia sp. PCC 7116]AFY54567.1 hypothetical protein Riv7116_2032 [Rivularia sp. PCC 7116]